MVTVGDAAPSFELPGTGGSDTEVPTYRLDDALGDGPVVLAFYAFDFHPGCAEQLCSIRDLSWFDVDPDVSVFGISTDRVFSHRAFAEQHDIDFPLLSDSDGGVAEAYDVFRSELLGHRRVSKRALFLLDTEGTVRYRWVGEGPEATPNLTPLYEALEEVSD
ncbi:redoxin domain-containing protein [Halorubrum sp. BOL3-1]|uniref:redoxin domain-containing protein n=1 Tax=Halorubrum sp. BOL3-1 TaxID=2497325 RepID=UPI001004E864|nr:redoxin domain-containing protein [Halorubrum sp. BOL3-1]QAU11903.1 redoxin domain-containing protein [Halorubrum sp. BOL3-1]